MRWSIPTVLACTAACGRLHFADLRGTPAADASDAPPDSPLRLCTWMPPNTPNSMVEPNLAASGFVRGVWLSTDGLDLTYSLDPGTGPQAWQSHRTAVDQVFGSPSIIPDFASLPVYGVAYTVDQLDAIVFHDQDLYESQRSSTSDPWPTPIVIAALPTDKQNEFPWISPDGDTLWFNDAGTVQTDQAIFVTTRTSRASAWDAPTMVPELYDPAHESFHPSLDAAQLTVVFASPRVAGEIRIWYSTRPSIDASWSAPQQFLVRTEDINQADPALSGDGCDLAFASPPGDADGQWHNWTSNVPP